MTFHAKTYTNGFPLNGQDERLSNGLRTVNQAVWNGFIERLNGLLSIPNGQPYRLKGSPKRSNGLPKRSNGLWNFPNGLPQRSNGLWNPPNGLSKRSNGLWNFWLKSFFTAVSLTLRVIVKQREENRNSPLKFLI